MTKNCCVCGDSKESPENRLFRCGGQGCGITVHQACYGIITIPSGLWFCRKCESQERAARVKCELCPRKDGALKRTDSGTWAHVVCALYIPEVTFGNLRTMEPIITSKLPRERFAKVCYICESLGQESQASTGACMSCHRSNCRLSFHVTCAQKDQLLVEEQDTRDSRNIIYCGYCASHYKKMMKQKMKLKKQQQQQQIGLLHAGGGIGTSVPSGGPSIGTGISPLGVGVADNRVGVVDNRMGVADNKVGVADNREGVSSSRGDSLFNSMGRSAVSHPLTHPQSDNASSHYGSNHYNNKHTSKIKMESERITKRSSSDIGLISSVKRKYRRRKLSSDESSSSESLSISSEVTLQLPSPPITSPHDNVILHEEKYKDEDSHVISEMGHVTSEMDHVTNEMDCGNLDLLASVTQRIDKVDGLSTVPCTSIEPPAKIRAPSVPIATTSESKETVKRSVSVSGRSGRGGSRKRKSTINSNATNQQQPINSNSAQLNPPTSLQELLERQWGQTAQFILDQAGKQNNAGVMLTHLHELQSENRSMQSRIMELASQREFFLATNSRLRQTLTINTPVTKNINGIAITNNIPPPSNHHYHHRPIEVNNLPSRSHRSHAVVMATDTKSTAPQISSSNVKFNSLEDYSSPTFGNILQQDTTGSPYTTIVRPHNIHYSNDVTPTTNNIHEVTYVTNSVQGPITAFTGLPDNSPSSYQTLSHRHST